RRHWGRPGDGGIHRAADRRLQSSTLRDGRPARLAGADHQSSVDSANWSLRARDTSNSRRIALLGARDGSHARQLDLIRRSRFENEAGGRRPGCRPPALACYWTAASARGSRPCSLNACAATNATHTQSVTTRSLFVSPTSAMTPDGSEGTFDDAVVTSPPAWM